MIIVWKVFSVFSFPKAKSNFHCVKTKNQKQVFGVFWKLRTKFSGNLVNKPKSCVTHTMCCLIQTQQNEKQKSLIRSHWSNTKPSPISYHRPWPLVSALSLSLLHTQLATINKPLLTQGTTQNLFSLRSKFGILCLRACMCLDPQILGFLGKALANWVLALALVAFLVTVRGREIERELCSYARELEWDYERKRDTKERRDIVGLLLDDRC